MVINYARAFCVWEQAGLELRGEIYLLNSEKEAFAKEAASWWRIASQNYSDVDVRYWWASLQISPKALAQEAARAASRAELALSAYKGGWKIRDTAIDQTELMPARDPPHWQNALHAHYRQITSAGFTKTVW
jgi:hypothetical protein